MAWLLRRGEVLASVDLLAGQGRRGLSRSGCAPADGIAVLSRTRLVHTLTLRRPLDVAYLSEDLVVVATRRFPPRRIGLPRRAPQPVLRAEAGSFERWSLRAGDQLELKE
jgi:hypothetical protein